MTSTLLYLFGIVLLLIGVGVSIALHELGHLWPAKAFKVPVSRYMIGFGPTLFSRKRGETEYGIKLFPLGGYIAMAGMVPPGTGKAPKTWLQRWIADSRRTQQEADGSYEESRAFYRLPVLKRMVIMLGGPFANLVLGTILVTIALSGIGSYSMTTTIEKVLPCVRDYEPAPSKCLSSDSPSPALTDGLKSGDRVVSIDGKSISQWTQVQQAIDNSNGQPLDIVVDRNGSSATAQVTPVQLWRPVIDRQKQDYKLDASGKKIYHKAYVIGVQVQFARVPQSIGASLASSGSYLVGTGDMVLQLPQKIGEVAGATFGGGQRPLDAPVSIVGVGSIAGTIASSGDMDLQGKLQSGLLMLGSLNFALFVFNLIPLLPLDGGHVLNAIYEGLKRLAFKIARKRDPGPFDTAKLMPFTTVMWFVLVGLGVFMMFADVVKPVTI